MQVTASKMRLRTLIATYRSSRDLHSSRPELRSVTDYVTIVHMERERHAVRAPASADWLLSRGTSAMTVPELADLLDVPEDQVRRRLHAPASRREWVQPVRGLWVPVPPEYRTWGAPPGIELIDAMMRHLNTGYYVGWLSAAAIHGASHQAPQVFQVAVDRMVRDRTVGRTRFRFVQRPSAMDLPTIERPTRSGTARVSTPEVTALDVATDPDLAGGIDNSATVIIELADNDTFTVATLASLATRFPAASGRRVGYVLEHFTDHDDMAPLHDAVIDRSSSPSRLDPTRPAAGPVDGRWNLYLNRELEPEA